MLKNNSIVKKILSTLKRYITLLDKISAQLAIG